MSILKGRQNSIPFVEILKMGHRVAQDLEAPFEIESSGHFVHDVRVIGIIQGFQHVEELLAAHGEGIRVKRVDRDVRWQVIVLRAGAGVVVGADYHGDGGCIEVEQGMNALPA